MQGSCLSALVVLPQPAISRWLPSVNGDVMWEAEPVSMELLC